MDTPEIAVIVFVAGTIIVGRFWMDSIIEAIERFNDHFRGGGPKPMHPSPANDSALLSRRRLRS